MRHMNRALITPVKKIIDIEIIEEGMLDSEQF